MLGILPVKIEVRFVNHSRGKLNVHELQSLQMILLSHGVDKARHQSDVTTSWYFCQTRGQKFGLSQSNFTLHYSTVSSLILTPSRNDPVPWARLEDMLNSCQKERWAVSKTLITY